MVERGGGDDPVEGFVREWEGPDIGTAGPQFGRIGSGAADDGGVYIDYSHRSAWITDKVNQPASARFIEGIRLQNVPGKSRPPIRY